MLQHSWFFLVFVIKVWKRKLGAAMQSGDAEEIKR